MNLQWVSADVIIADLDSTFNVNSNNYIHKLSFWLTQAIANYGVYIPLEPAYTDLAITADGTVYIPDDVKGIVGLTYNGEYVPQGKCYRGFRPLNFSNYNDVIEKTGYLVEVVKDVNGNVVSKHVTDTQLPFVVKDTQDQGMYFVNNSRILTVTFGEEGDLVRLYYIRLPHDRDNLTGAYVVKVPDNEIIQQNLTWFILRNLLYSGYSHPTLNLGAAMPYLNPAKMYESTLPKARSQFLLSDRADYGKIKNMMTTLVHAYHDHSINLKQH